MIVARSGPNDFHILSVRIILIMTRFIKIGDAFFMRGQNVNVDSIWVETNVLLDLERKCLGRWEFRSTYESWFEHWLLVDEREGVWSSGGWVAGRVASERTISQLFESTRSLLFSELVLDLMLLKIGCIHQCWSRSKANQPNRWVPFIPSMTFSPSSTKVGSPHIHKVFFLTRLLSRHAGNWPNAELLFAG